MATNKNRGTSISRYNVIATYSSGKVGNARLYQHGNRSYVRAAYNSATTNPRTDNQMKRRLRWANMSHVYGYFKPQLLKSFEGTTPYRSTFNLFMQANSESGVYFTKGENDFRCAVLQPWQMSKGSLPEIQRVLESAGSGNLAYLTADKINIGESADITTIGKLSSVILNNNPQFKTGDKITFVLAQQLNRDRSDERVIPFIKANYFSFILNPNDTTNNTVWAKSPVTKSLCFNLPMDAGSDEDIWGFCYIWTRNEAGKMLVSESYLKLNSDTSYLSYLTDTAYNRAAESYGTTENVYLDPKNPVDVVTVTASVETGQESLGSVSGGGTYAKGSYVTLTATPVAPATFSEWSDGTTENPYIFFANSDITLKASFDGPES